PAQRLHGGRCALGRAHPTPLRRSTAGTAHARGHLPHRQLPGERTAVTARTRRQAIPAITRKLSRVVRARVPTATGDNQALWAAWTLVCRHREFWLSTTIPPGSPRWGAHS